MRLYHLLVGEVDGEVGGIGVLYSAMVAFGAVVEEEATTNRLSIFYTCLTAGSNVAILWRGPEVNQELLRTVVCVAGLLASTQRRLFTRLRLQNN